MESLRIAHVSATFPPYQAGTGEVCFHNAVELARRGHNVHVMTSAYFNAPSYEIVGGVHVHRLPALLRMGNAPLLPTLIFALRQFDIIHVHYPFIFGAELARGASLLFGIPMVATFHNDLVGDGARADLFALYQRLSAQTSLRCISRMCVLSNDHYRSTRLFRSLSNHAPPTIELPNGVDTDVFRPCSSDDAQTLRQYYKIPADAPLVLFVAALDRAHHFKNLSVLLQAMCRLSDPVYLLIVGDGDARDSYEQEAAQLGIKNLTIFAGSISHDDLAPYFTAADVFVLPSDPPESFGLVLVESLACETPVIAPDIPGVRTVVEPRIDGFLTTPHDVDELATTIRNVLSLSPIARRAMGKAGRYKIQERYEWAVIGAQLEKLYCEVLV